MALTWGDRGKDPVAVDHLAPEAGVVDFASDPWGSWERACSDVEISQDLTLQLRQAIGIEQLRDVTIDLPSTSILCFVRSTILLLVDLPSR